MVEFITITVPVVINADRLWGEVFGGGYEYSPVQCQVAFSGESAWDKAGIALVSIENPEDGEEAMVSKRVVIDDIAEAYGKLLTMGYHHCGAPLDLDSFDACASFDLLQMVVFGELVYG